jgi:hypothetical protein
LRQGYDAELLVEICELYLDARAQSKLMESQLRLATMAEIIVRACAKVGIIALIDEATGYQKIREKRALQLKLPATTPTPARPRRRQRAAVLTRHRRRDGRESRYE